MHTRQNAGADGDRANGTGIAAINAGLTIENLAAHDLGFQILENALDLVNAGGIHIFGKQLAQYTIANRVDFLVAVLLLADLVSFVQIGLSH